MNLKMRIIIPILVGVLGVVALTFFLDIDEFKSLKETTSVSSSESVKKKTRGVLEVKDSEEEEIEDSKESPSPTESIESTDSSELTEPIEPVTREEFEATLEEAESNEETLTNSKLEFAKANLKVIGFEGRPVYRFKSKYDSDFETNDSYDLTSEQQTLYFSIPFGDKGDESFIQFPIEDDYFMPSLYENNVSYTISETEVEGKHITLTTPSAYVVVHESREKKGFVFPIKIDAEGTDLSDYQIKVGKYDLGNAHEGVINIRPPESLVNNIHDNPLVLDIANGQGMLLSVVLPRVLINQRMLDEIELVKQSN